jgi:hypothetical protein
MRKEFIRLLCTIRQLRLPEDMIYEITRFLFYDQYRAQVRKVRARAHKTIETGDRSSIMNSFSGSIHIKIIDVWMSLDTNRRKRRTLLFSPRFCSRCGDYQMSSLKRPMDDEDFPCYCVCTFHTFPIRYSNWGDIQLGRILS